MLALAALVRNLSFTGKINPTGDPHWRCFSLDARHYPAERSTSAWAGRFSSASPAAPTKARSHRPPVPSLSLLKGHLSARHRSPAEGDHTGCSRAWIGCAGTPSVQPGETELAKVAEFERDYATLERSLGAGAEPGDQAIRRRRAARLATVTASWFRAMREVINKLRQMEGVRRRQRAIFAGRRPPRQVALVAFSPC